MSVADVRVVEFGTKAADKPASSSKAIGHRIPPGLGSLGCHLTENRHPRPGGTRNPAVPAPMPQNPTSIPINPTLVPTSGIDPGPSRLRPKILASRPHVAGAVIFTLKH